MSPIYAEFPISMHYKTVTTVMIRRYRFYFLRAFNKPSSVPLSW